jgi:branched-chain amino acid transport system ATP-binding protein
MTALLAVEDLDVHYGGIHALQRVSFAVDEGQIVALIGANGAGKTTALRAISGLVRPSGGRVRFAGQPITGLPAHAIVARGLAHVPEGRGIFANLTVDENLQLGAYLRSDPTGVARDRDRALELFPRIRERLDQNAGTLSGGEQQMLAMSRALSTNPKLLLLDEISMGLAPLIVAELYSVVANLAADGLTILVVEQSARTALDVADRAAVMAHGQIVLEGTPEVVADSVLDIYLAGGSS